MKKKIKNRSGETLVETLFSMLVIVLAVLMLAGSVVAAAKVNKSGKDIDTAIQYDNTNTVSEVKVTISHVTVPDTEVSVTAYQTNDDNHYCYYEK